MSDPISPEQRSALCDQLCAQVLAGKRVELAELTLNASDLAVIERAIDRVRRFQQRRDEAQQYPRLHTSAWLPGQILRDKYQVLQKLGVGGMGEVYSVRRLSDGRELAAKRVRDPEHGGALDPLAVLEPRRTQQRAILDEIIRGMELPAHENVLRCQHFDIIDHGFVLFSEYARYGSLASCLQNGSLFADPETAGEQFLSLAQQTLAGLKHLHSHHVVHQDIKPGNILLMRLEGGLRALIGDLGIAHEQLDGFAPTIGYSPRYASPEQLQQAPLSDRSDVYSWAVTMLETAGGGRTELAASAKAGDSSSVRQLLQQRFQLDHERLPELLAQALSPTPEQRPSAFELYDGLEIQVVTAGMAIAATMPDALEDLGLDSLYEIEARAEPCQAESKPPRRKRTVKSSSLPAPGRMVPASPRQQLIALASTEILHRAVEDGDLQLDAQAQKWMAAILGEDQGAYWESLAQVCGPKERDSQSQGALETIVDLMSRAVKRADYSSLPHRQREYLAQARLALLMQGQGESVSKSLHRHLRQAKLLLINRGDHGMRQLADEIERTLGRSDDL